MKSFVSTAFRSTKWSIILPIAACATRCAAVCSRCGAFRGAIGGAFRLLPLDITAQVSGTSSRVCVRGARARGLDVDWPVPSGPRTTSVPPVRS